MKETEKQQAERLADLIEANPDCKFRIDNDCWYIHFADETIDDYLAKSDNFPLLGICYGDGITEALIIILNRKGFNLKSEGV